MWKVKIPGDIFRDVLKTTFVSFVYLELNFTQKPGYIMIPEENGASKIFTYHIMTPQERRNTVIFSEQFVSSPSTTSIVRLWRTAHCSTTRSRLSGK